MKRLNGRSEVKCDEGQESRLTLFEQMEGQNLHLLVWGNWWEVRWKDQQGGCGNQEFDFRHESAHRHEKGQLGR